NPCFLEETVMKPTPTSTRRQFLIQAGLSGLATPALLREAGAAAPPFPRGKAESCVFLWLGGGACHIDTWDPKRKGDGKKVAGSYYDPVSTAIPGAKVCQHLQRTARLLDRCA